MGRTSHGQCSCDGARVQLPGAGGVGGSGLGGGDVAEHDDGDQGEEHDGQDGGAEVVAEAGLHRAR